MKEPIYISTLDTIYGTLILGECEEKLCLCYWTKAKYTSRVLSHLQILWAGSATVAATPLFCRVAQQMREYQECGRQNFDLPLHFVGTPFQISVWKELLKIPYGTTLTYQEISLRLNRVEAVRAVANAVAVNPLQIIVPCHRIVGARGNLGGYAGGPEVKRQLLRQECSCYERKSEHLQ